MKKIVCAIMVACIVAAIYFGYQFSRSMETKVLDKGETATQLPKTIFEPQSQNSVKSFVQKNFKGDVLSIDIESLIGEQIRSITLNCKNPAWGGPDYSLSLDADHTRYANVFKIGLGIKQSYYQLVYDREYVITTGRVSVAFRTPKAQEGKHLYEVDIKIPGGSLPDLYVPAQPSIKLVYDSSSIKSDSGYIIYADRGRIGFEERLSENPDGFLVGRLGGELAIIDTDSRLALCYYKKVPRKDLGSLPRGSDVNFMKNTKVKVSLVPPEKAAAAKGGGLFFDEKSAIPLASFPLHHGEIASSSAIVYVGKWNLRWIGTEGILESYDVIVAGDGKVERINK